MKQGGCLKNREKKLLTTIFKFEIYKLLVIINILDIRPKMIPLCKLQTCDATTMLIFIYSFFLLHLLRYFVSLTIELAKHRCIFNFFGWLQKFAQGKFSVALSHIAEFTCCFKWKLYYFHGNLTQFKANISWTD